MRQTVGKKWVVGISWLSYSYWRPQNQILAVLAIPVVYASSELFRYP
jgi:hypothetical protein